MTVIDKREFRDTEFKNIEPGNTFFWEQFYFLRLAKRFDARFNTGDANAICLTDGVPEKFEEDDVVTPVNATLTIS